MTDQPDHTERFVMDTGAVYPGNVAALWAADPVTAAAVEAVEDRDVYATVESKSGHPTVAVGTPPTYLHSRHQPVVEATRLVESVGVGDRLIFHLFGLGLGHHLRQLFDRAGEEAVFLVFEPDPILLRTTLQTRDFAELIKSRRVIFFTRLDKADLFVRLQPLTPMISLGTVDVDHPASVRLHGAFFDQQKKWLAEFESFSRTNLNTLVLNGRRTLENIARNVGHYAVTPGPGRLKNRYQGRPAVIVSAGPSLRKNKHRLKELSGRAVIIAVQTTLQPLLELGVIPDFVTALDYHDICTRFFEKLPPTLKTELVAEPKATSAIFALNPGPLTILGNEWAESLLREMRLDKPKLPAGSTVAHLAYYLAEHLGCGPIIFVGQDLGFSDGLYYSPGTSYEDVWRPETGRFCTPEMKQWEQVVRERPILRKIPDQHGRPMYTEERLFTYLQQFERDFLRTKTTIIDATEGGAAKRGTVVMAPDEAMRLHCTDPLPAVADDYESSTDRGAACAASLSTRRDEAKEIESISRETLPLLQKLRDHLEDQPRVNRLIPRVDRLRGRMNELGRTYDLVMQMAQSTDLERFKADRRVSAARLTGTDRQRGQVARDIDNVRGVMAAAVDFQQLMDDAIDRLGVPAGERSAVAA